MPINAAHAATTTRQRRRLRVMHVVLSLSPGGTERLVIEISRRLADRVSPLVCCLDDEGEWAEEIRELRIPLVALQRPPGFHPRLAYRIAKLARDYSVEALHCHHYSSYVYGALATLMNRRLGLVFTEHGRLSDAAPSPRRQLVNPWFSRLRGRICAVSGDLKQHMVAEGFPERRVDVVYNGIDVGERPGAVQRAEARAALDLPPDVPVIGTVARLDPVKNLSLALQAHRELLQRRPDAQLVMIGGGPEQPALEAEARALGIDDRVRFAGYRRDVRQLLPAFDVYVNSSIFEGVSLTILEAMAAGLPVVATRVGGNPEVVTDAQTGLLVPGGDVASLADALTALVTDRAARERMGAGSRARVVEHFAIERMTGAYLSEYERQAGRVCQPA